MRLLFQVVARAVQITLILLGMLLAWLYVVTGLRRLLWAVFFPKRTYEKLSNPRILRRAFEAMGPSFIKLGQVVASSPGIFPQRYSDEFQHCLDKVKPFPVEKLKVIVEESLGKPIEEVFESFELEPLGSASIAQVHAARLRGEGLRDVVVKVQRPKIARKVSADIWVMKRGAWVAERLFKGARLSNVSGVIEDFERTIYEELNFVTEAENLSEFNALMAKYGIADVKAPEPVMAWTTERVLVMERFHGLRADDRDGIVAAGIDPQVQLRDGLRAWVMTMALDGFFHGDVHAGNLLMLPDGAADGGPAVGLLDFGIIGRFSVEERHQVLRYILAFTARDYEALADVMSEIGAIEEDIDRGDFVSELERVYSPLIEKNLADIRYDEVLPEITALSYRYGIRLPSAFLLIIKQLLFFDRYAKLMAPDLNVFSDWHLVDFLFGPLGIQSGLDFNLLWPLLEKVREKFADQALEALQKAKT